MSSTVVGKKVVSVKMPVDLLDWVKRQSAEGERSMNRQVVLLLQQARQQSSLEQKDVA